MQSMFNKQHLLEEFVDRSPNFTALCITEAWLSPEKSSLINCTGYNLAASYWRPNSRGGGVCILLQNEFEYLEKQDITNLSVEHVIELCAIIISRFNVLLIVLYWNGKKAEVFYRQLTKLLNLINNKYN